MPFWVESILHGHEYAERKKKSHPQKDTAGDHTDRACKVQACDNTLCVRMPLLSLVVWLAAQTTTSAKAARRIHMAETETPRP